MLEPVWMTKEIRMEVKMKWEFNRRKRKGSVEDIEENQRSYSQHIECVKTLIRREKEKHDEKMTQEKKMKKTLGRRCVK